MKHGRAASGRLVVGGPVVIGVVIATVGVAVVVGVPRARVGTTRRVVRVALRVVSVWHVHVGAMCVRKRRE